MKERLRNRLQGLKTEYEAGRKMLIELESKRDVLTQTLLRISGAIQVIEELLSSELAHGDDAQAAGERTA
jgi:hypothetical protein